MVELILREDVDDLGDAGDVVDVKPGYARNYLLPQGLAYRASEGNLKRLQEERRREEKAAARVRDKAAELASRLEGQSVTFSVRAGEDGQLFGSVTATDITERLQENGLDVARQSVELEEPIKQLGVYTVPLDLHAEVRPEIKVWVVSQD